MIKEVDVIFTGAVFEVHVNIHNHELTLVKGPSNTWKGRDEINIEENEATLGLKFTAPSFTEWSITMNCDGNKCHSDSGSSETSEFSKTWPIKCI